MILQKEFFNRHAKNVARDLIGKELILKTNKGEILSGIINETEAYHGFDDDACHGSKGKTPRCEFLFAEAGYIYVYFTYGMYYMINLVTHEKDFPSAVLIRSIIPKKGKDIMAKNRFGIPSNKLTVMQNKNLTNGPGKITVAFNIDRENFNGTKIGEKITIKDNKIKFNKKKIQLTPRIGINSSIISKEWLWRFYIEPSDLSL